MSENRQQTSIDLSRLRETFAEWGLEEDEIQDLVAVFLADFPDGLTRLETAIGTGNATAITREAHALKSPAATMGANLLADLMHRIETFDGDFSNGFAEQRFRDAACEFSAVRNKLIAEFPTLAEV